MKCAAIDLGTNTARLLVGDRDSGRLNTICIEREIVRLGGNFTHDAGLSADAQLRAINCMKRFSQIMGSHGVKSVLATATSAVRDAVNGALFVEMVLKETGIKLNIIDGDLEGRLTLKGVISGLDQLHENILVIDVGGGSTEITIASDGVPRFVRSLPLGVVRLTEGFVTPQAMRSRIENVFKELKEELLATDLNIKQDCVMVATAGTATTLAAIKMEMVDYDYRRVNNFIISRAEIVEIYERLLPLQPEERILIPGLEKGREDLIISGILILLNAMDSLGFTEIKVSDYGLLEGLALSEDLV